MTETMQAIQVHRYGGSEELKLERIPRPEPKTGELLVRVCSWGLADRDSRTFALHEAPQAHQLSETGHGRGRIVLHIADA